MSMFNDVNGKLSAKRVIGGVGLMLTIIVGLTMLILSIFPNYSIDGLAIGLIGTIAGLCSSLIGLSVAEKPKGD